MSSDNLSQTVVTNCPSDSDNPIENIGCHYVTDRGVKPRPNSLALAQELLREARERLFHGEPARPAFESALRSWEAAKAIAEQQATKQRAERTYGHDEE